MRKAMVMAAGLGKRMRPLTEYIPKPLIEVAGITLIDRTLDWLSASGIEGAVVNTHYLYGMLEAHLALRSRPRILISREELLLETGGGIQHALPLLGSDAFFSVNSDVICMDGPTPALARLADCWDTSTDMVLLVHPVDKAIGYYGSGDFFVNGKEIIRRGDKAQAPFVFTGIQLLHPRIFVDTPTGSFSLNLLYDRALAHGRLKAVIHDGQWLHIGDPQGIQDAEAILRG
jgi:MurNAc alpha-1-phosphate uridylyltransferase